MNKAILKSFRFKKGALWDGDEAIFDYIQEELLEDIKNPSGMLVIKEDTTISLIITHPNRKIKGKT